MILKDLTSCYAYNDSVGAPDVLLEKLKTAQIKPSTLARALNVKPSMASMMLAGKRGIPTWHLDAIADLLGVSVPDLFVRSVQNSTVLNSTPVAESRLSSRSEGSHGASTIDFQHLVGLSLPERVAAAARITLQLNALLRGRPESASADARQPKRSAGRK